MLRHRRLQNILQAQRTGCGIWNSLQRRGVTEPSLKTNVHTQSSDKSMSCISGQWKGIWRSMTNGRAIFRESKSFYLTRVHSHLREAEQMTQLERKIGRVALRLGQITCHFCPLVSSFISKLEFLPSLTHRT